jgi:hypothetical protein
MGLYNSGESRNLERVRSYSSINRGDIITLAQWIKKYEEKAEEYKLLPGFTVYYDPDKGFFCWRAWQDVFEVDHSCTNDYRYFNEVANNIAKMYRCNIMRTATYRDPVAYWRLQRGSGINFALSGIRPNGKFYWVFEKEVD